MSFDTTTRTRPRPRPHSPAHTQPYSSCNILADIYIGLAITSPCSQRARIHRIISPKLTKPFPTSNSPRHDPKSSSSIPLNSLLPPQLPLPPARRSNAIRTVPIPSAAATVPDSSLATLASSQADSLTRERKGKMPALSHLLSIEQGKVLSLAADEAHVYAGCQSEGNEITVCRRSV